MDCCLIRRRRFEGILASSYSADRVTTRQDNASLIIRSQEDDQHEKT
jgi:hypothetical protein